VVDRPEGQVNYSITIPAIPMLLLLIPTTLLQLLQDCIVMALLYGRAILYHIILNRIIAYVVFIS
jgi:hypothetical protein